MTTSRKVRAIAAGGAVLGLGAVVTLAAWSDSEFAEGIFGTGTFGIEASTADGEYGEHATEGEALQLAFPLDEGGEDSVVTLQAPALTDTFGDTLSTEVLYNGTALAAGETFELTGQTPAELTVNVTLADTFAENESDALSTIVYSVVAEYAEEPVA